MEAWQRLYSKNYPVLFVKDLLPEKLKCYKSMVVNVFAAISPLSKRVGSDSPCSNSTLLKAFRDFFLTSFNLKYMLPASYEDKLTITIIERKDYVGDKHVGNR